MAALERALALADREDLARRVAEDLDLDVARVLDEELGVHAVVREVRLRLALRAREGLGDLRLAAHDAHALAAAAGRRLQEEREAVLPAEGRDLRGRRRGRRHAGDDGDARRDHPLAGLRLARPSHRSRTGAGPTHVEPRVEDCLREGRVLGEESEAGVDERRARLAGGRDELLRDEVALARGGRADRDGVVREADVERAAVGLGVDRDGRDSEVAAGADDPHGDLAAVRDEEPRRAHSGIFPCFLGGMTSRLFARRSSARMRRGRVVRGRDHVVDVPAPRCDVRVRERLLVLGDARRRGPWRRPSAALSSRL